MSKVKRKFFPRWFPFWKLFSMTHEQLSGDKVVLGLPIAIHDRWKDELVDERLRRGSWQ